MGRKVQKWTIGDIFTVRLLDERFGVGQIVGREPDVLNSVTVALFDQACSSREGALFTEIADERVFSVVFATRDLLDAGVWAVIGNRPVNVSKRLFPYEDKRSSGFVGAKVIGSKILGEFLNAYFGLTWWDDWKDPDYLDRLLVSPEKKPKHVMLKALAH